MSELRSIDHRRPLVALATVIEALVREAHDRFASLGRPGAAAICRLNLGMLDQERGDLPAAASHYREALAIFRERGDREFTTQCLMGLSAVHYSTVPPRSTS